MSVARRVLLALSVFLTLITGVGSGTRAAAAGTADGSFVSLPDTRIFDTSAGVNVPRAPIAANGTLTAQITGLSGVPSSGVSAVVINLTIVASTAAGNIFAYAAGAAKPPAAVQNFTPNQTVHALIVIPIGAGGKISLTNGSTGSTHLTGNVTGYFIAGTAAGAGTFTPIPGTILFDTRRGLNAPAGPLPAWSTTSIRAAGLAGIPSSNVSAVLINMTVNVPTAAGSVVAYKPEPDDYYPDASSMSFARQQTVHNLVLAPLDAAGKFTVQNQSEGTAQLIGNVVGYFRKGSATAAGAFTPVNPAGAFDTAQGLFAPYPTAAANATLTVPVTGRNGIPRLGVAAVAVNITAVGGDASGNITAYQTNTTRPSASDLFFPAHQTVSQLMIVPVSPNGTISIANRSVAATSVRGDVSGYFLSSTQAPLDPLTWTTSTPTVGTGAMIDCVSSTFCMMVDGLRSQTFNGTTWTAKTFFARASPGSTQPGTAIEDVSCISKTFCMAVNTRSAFTFNGTSWTGPVVIDNQPGMGSHMQGVSCAGPSFCVAVDDDGYAMFFNGTRWAPPRKVAEAHDSYNAFVDCPAVGFCMATFGRDSSYPGSTATRFNGTSWTAPVNIYSPSGPEGANDWVESLSCPTTSSCLSVAGPHGISYNNSSWSPPKAIAPFVDDRQYWLSGASCATAGFCVGVFGGQGRATTFNGVEWSLPRLVTNSGLSDVSCPAVNFCMAVGGDQVAIGRR